MLVHTSTAARCEENCHRHGWYFSMIKSRYKILHQCFQITVDVCHWHEPHTPNHNGHWHESSSSIRDGRHDLVWDDLWDDLVVYLLGLHNAPCCMPTYQQEVESLREAKLHVSKSHQLHISTQIRASLSLWLMIRCFCHRFSGILFVMGLALLTLTMILSLKKEDPSMYDVNDAEDVVRAVSECIIICMILFALVQEILELVK